MFHKTRGAKIQNKKQKAQGHHDFRRHRSLRHSALLRPGNCLRCPFPLMATSSASVLAQYDAFVAPTYGRFPLVVERGEGAHVWDLEGRQFLDFGTGIAVCSLGHGHPALVRAYTEQVGRLIHVSNLYHVAAQSELAERLSAMVGSPGKSFFCNSGAEANEGLIKLARRYGNTTRPGGRHTVLTFTNSFHGRTLAGIAATGQEKVRIGFDPVTPGFRHLPFNDLAAVRRAIDSETVAILLESIQGEGGIYPASPEFLHGLRGLCDEHDLLLLIDEVQCGLGRTGEWCAWKGLGAAEVEPDGVAWAKGLGGGHPLGAIWFSDQRLVHPKEGEPFPLSQLLGPGSHGTTFGGGPLACRVALAVLDTIEKEGLLERVRQTGKRLVEAIAAFHSPLVRQIRGRGLMIGLELNGEAVKEKFASTADFPPARLFTEAALAAGLLVVPSVPDTIRLLPPLTIGEEEVRECLEILGTLLASQPALAR